MLYLILQDQMFLSCLLLPEVFHLILIATFPKFRFGGVIPNVGATPVPCTEYTVGDPAALCVIVKLSVFVPTAVGVNVTSNTWFPPAAIVTGNTFGVNVNCPSDDVIFDITRLDVPGVVYCCLQCCI